MATAARLTLAVWRNEICFRTIRVVGLDLTSSTFGLQVRMRPDTPGTALIDLTTKTDNTEGVQLMGVETIDGIPVSTLRVRINANSLQALPYSGELGADTVLAFAMQIDAMTRLYGDFVVKASTYGSDTADAQRDGGAAITSTAAPFDTAVLTIADEEVIELKIDGASALGAINADAALSATMAAEARDEAGVLAAEAAASAIASDTLEPALLENLQLAAPPAFGKAYRVVDEATGAQDVRWDGARFVRLDDGRPAVLPGERPEISMVPSIGRYRKGVAQALGSASSLAVALGVAPGASFGDMAIDRFNGENAGVIVQDAITNRVANGDAFIGFKPGVLGADGALPAYWQYDGSVLTGATVTLSDAIFADGSPAIRVRLAWTTTSPSLFLQFTAKNRVTTVQGETWTMEVPVAVTGASRGVATEIGSYISWIEPSLFEKNSLGANLVRQPPVTDKRNIQRLFDANATAPDAPSRVRYTGTMGNASTAYVCPGLYIGGGSLAAEGGWIEFLIGAPWMAAGSVAHLRPAPTFGVSAARDADLTQALDITAATKGRNLVRNGKPVVSPKMWSITSGATAALSMVGDELRVESTQNGTTIAEQIIATVPGQTYQWSATGRKAGSSGNATLNFVDATSGVTISSTSFTTEDATAKNGTFIAASNQTILRLISVVNAAGQGTQWKDIEVRGSAVSWSFAVEALCSSIEGTLVEFVDDATTGLRLYRTGKTFYVRPVTAGADGAATALGEIAPHAPIRLIGDVVPGGDITLQFNDKPVVTLAGLGATMTKAWLGRRHDGSARWNGAIQRFDVHDRTGLLTPMTPLAVYDDFDRADGDLGYPWIGVPWAWVETAAEANQPDTRKPVIVSGAVVPENPSPGQGSTYWAQNLDTDVIEMGAIISFSAGTTVGGAAGLHIGTTPLRGSTVDEAIDDSSNDAVENSIHVTFGSTFAAVTFFENADNSINKSLINYPTACATDGTKYEAGYRVDYEAGTLTLLLPGDWIAVIADERVKRLRGKSAIWENFFSAATDPRCSFHAVWAK